MKLTDLHNEIARVLGTTPALTSVPKISQLSATYEKDFEAAIKAPGVAIVIWVASGSLRGGSEKKPILDLENTVLISVVESRKNNTSGLCAFDYVGHVLKTLHCATYGTEVAGRNMFFLGEPAYDLGPLDAGIVTYFCKARIKSLDTVYAAG